MKRAEARREFPARALVVLPATFGSFGDEGLAHGSVKALQLQGRSVTLAVPGDPFAWKDIGVPVVSLSEIPSHASYIPKGYASFSEYDELYVIGADAIDGAYGIREISYRIALLNHFASTSRSSKLINFSVRSSVSAEAVRLLRLTSSNVEIWTRDRQSMHRAEQLFGRRVEVDPDVARLMSPVAPRNMLEVNSEMERVRAGSPRNEIVALVVNGHLQSSREAPIDLVEYFAGLSTCLSARGFGVLLMAHDVRSDPGDPRLVRDVANAIKDSANYAISTPSSAQEAKWILQRCNSTVSARMHGGVASMSGGVPSVGLDYVDKFSGQYEWYGLHDFVIPWMKGLDPDLIADRLLQVTSSDWLSHRGLLDDSLPAWIS